MVMSLIFQEQFFQAISFSKKQNNNNNNLYQTGVSLVEMHHHVGSRTRHFGTTKMSAIMILYIKFRCSFILVRSLRFIPPIVIFSNHQNFQTGNVYNPEHGWPSWRKGIYLTRPPLDAAPRTKISTELAETQSINAFVISKSSNMTSLHFICCKHQ